jgi:hypothetical protein
LSLGLLPLALLLAPIGLGRGLQLDQPFTVAFRHGLARLVHPFDRVAQLPGILEDVRLQMAIDDVPVGFTGVHHPAMPDVPWLVFNV